MWTKPPRQGLHCSTGVQARFVGTGRRCFGSASNGTVRKAMQCKIKLSYEVGKLPFWPGNEHAPAPKRILDRQRQERETHSPWSPLGFWWFAGTVSTLGCRGNCWHRSGFRKPLPEQNCAPGRKKQAWWGQASSRYPSACGSLENSTVRTISTALILLVKA